jgi:hypothetical protein
VSENPWRGKWQRRYRNQPFPFSTEPNAFLVSHARHLGPGLRVLCPGDGEGRNALWLARQGCHVTAVDFSDVALARLGECAARDGVPVTAIEADLSRWDWPRQAFDLVALIFVQLTPDQRVPVHAGAAASLAPGGTLLLEAFARGERLACGPPTDEARYDAAMLRRDFAGLDVLELLTGQVTLAEGDGHLGPANVVRLVAARPPTPAGG